jgi:NTP pyrophosphatase (non-canonical NTP hydrolase)
MNIQTQIDLVRDWGKTKDIIGANGTGTEKAQTMKLIEEVEELVEANFKNDHDEKIDAIGDCTVVLILLAEIIGVSFEDCLEKAYQIISNRTGEMVDGTFVKDTKLTK